MLNRADYRKMKKWLEYSIIAMKEDAERSPMQFVAITEGLIESYAGLMRIRCNPPSDWPVVISKLADACGLVDDGTGTGTLTIPEHVGRIESVLRSLRE